jgi:repressor LexA
MKELGRRLRQLREDRGLYQSDLAKIFEKSQSAIGKYENETLQLDYEMLRKYAEYFNVTIDYLLGKVEKPNEYNIEIPDFNSNEPILLSVDRSEINEFTKEKWSRIIKAAVEIVENGNYKIIPKDNSIPAGPLHKIPIIGSVRCGYGGAAIEEHIGYDFSDVKNPEEFFFLEVNGDSMEPQIQEGDLALVHRQPDVENGELAVVVINGEEGTLKKVIKKDNGTYILQAFNSNFEPLSFAGDDLNKIHICGKVVETKKKW